MCLVGFVVLLIMMVICFGIALVHLLSRFVKILNFMNSWRWMDKSCWPRCLLWHGWLPVLSGVFRGSPWALGHVEGACNLLENALGSCTSALLLDWRLPDGFDAESAALHVAGEPDVWTVGSMVGDEVSAVSSSGAGFSTGRAGRFWAERSWGHIDDSRRWNCCLLSWLLFCPWSLAVCPEG